MADASSVTQLPIDGVIAEGATISKVAGGFTFTEGPIWHPREDWLVFSDIAESIQYRWNEADGLKTFRHPSNQANGNCFDREGRIITCEHASSHLVIHDHGGKRVSVLASHHCGKELNSPNDVICDSKGRIWFTDPSFGRTREDLGLLREQDNPVQGVYRLDPDGHLTLVCDDFLQPNGLCLSNDETQLFVNDSWGPTIRRFEVDDDGNLTGGGVWATISGEGEGVPDGMKVDLDNRIFCNGPGGVHVLSPEGAFLGKIATPEKSTNFCFGGRGGRTLFITACTSVYAIETLTNAKPMIPGMA
ncbi:SMP-30/gluconolactonase/LRE family protein [Ahrensia marina]|uniref:SMP-30/gluconolactonase/LRE family protein n=1 Tax=Ahrensia marina TaxID=1514904 RepID=UPI0035D02168